MFYATLDKLLGFSGDLFRNRSIIINLAKNDFKAKFLGSYLGFVWAFIQPLVLICLLWLVFEVGFRSGPVNNMPYILWLSSGLIPWFFFSETLAEGTYSIVSHSYLVKQVVFRVSVLPLFKIFSGVFVHLFFIGFIFALFAIYGFPLSLYNLQVFYFLFAAMMLLLGLTWITSTLVIFVKDVGQLVNVITQVWFWTTPIVWAMTQVPTRYAPYMKLNPLMYIIEGYRMSFIYKEWFWDKPLWTLYYWCFTSFVLALGAFLYIRLRRHFADVI